MHVAQLLNPLLGRPDIEIVIPRLPKGESTGTGAQLLRHNLFQHLDGHCQTASLGFAHQQVDMFRHDHVTGDVESVPAAHALQGLLEYTSGLRSP